MASEAITLSSLATAIFPIIASIAMGVFSWWANKQASEIERLKQNDREIYKAIAESNVAMERKIADAREMVLHQRIATLQEINSILHKA